MNLLSSVTGFSSGEAKNPETSKPVYTGLAAEMIYHLIDTMDTAVEKGVAQINHFYNLEASTVSQSQQEAPASTTTEVTGATALHAAQTPPMFSLEAAQLTTPATVEQAAQHRQLQPMVTPQPQQAAHRETPDSLEGARRQMAEAYGQSPLSAQHVASSVDELVKGHSVGTPWHYPKK